MYARGRSTGRPAAAILLAARLVLAASLTLACAGGGGSGALGGLLGGSGLGSLGGEPDTATIASGLREALRVGTKNAVLQTSREDGFLGNSLIRIGLPESLQKMAGALRTFGMGRQIDELELAMNRAAEQAAGEATEVFVGAIRSMTIADARDILTGGDTAATEYFRRTTGDTLRARFAPIVDDKMQQVGLAQTYRDFIGRYEALPIPGRPAAPNLENYVTDRALDGLFTVLGEQEKRIRTDPAARVNDLLRRVFGS